VNVLLGKIKGSAALLYMEVERGMEEEYDGFEWVAEKHRTWS